MRRSTANDPQNKQRRPEQGHMGQTPGDAPVAVCKTLNVPVLPPLPSRLNTVRTAARQGSAHDRRFAGPPPIPHTDRRRRPSSKAPLTTPTLYCSSGSPPKTQGHATKRTHARHACNRPSGAPPRSAHNRRSEQCKSYNNRRLVPVKGRLPCRPPPASARRARTRTTCGRSPRQKVAGAILRPEATRGQPRHVSLHAAPATGGRWNKRTHGGDAAHAEAVDVGNGLGRRSTQRGAREQARCCERTHPTSRWRKQGCARRGGQRGRAGAGTTAGPVEQRNSCKGLCWRRAVVARQTCDKSGHRQLRSVFSGS